MRRSHLLLLLLLRCHLLLLVSILDLRLICLVGLREAAIEVSLHLDFDCVLTLFLVIDVVNSLLDLLCLLD
jgi:hypothetical protein